MAEPRVVLLTRTGCHLCEDAEAVVRQVCQERRVSWRCDDVDADPELKAQWSDHVPVTFVDGRVLSYFFLDPAVLMNALAS